MSAISLTVNGRSYSLDVDPSTPLLYVLSDDLELRGPKFGCGLAQCGSCTVIVDGRAIRSCVTPVQTVDGADITTLEGLGTPESPHPIQRAFIEEQAAQCGFCLSGVILTAKAFLDESPKATDDEIREALSTVLCRCFVNGRMFRAIRRYARERTGTVSDTLAAVLKTDPDWSLAPKGISPTLLVFLRRCLQKDPKQRIGDIHDVRLALDGAFETPASHTEAPAALSTPRSRVAWMACGAAVPGMFAFAIPAARHLREMPPPETRVDIVTPGTPTASSLALSPDGRQIVFTASADGVSRLWLRNLASATAQPLSGTEGTSLPFWSPDSRSVGFFADDRLKRLDLGGGAPQTLAPVVAGRGGTWNAEASSSLRRTPRARCSALPHRGGRRSPLPRATRTRTTGIRPSCLMAVGSYSSNTARRTHRESTLGHSTLERPRS